MAETTRLTLREPQIRSLLAAVRNKMHDYEEELDDAEEEEPRSWYEARLAELRPLERRLNSAGLRLTQPPPAAIEGQLTIEDVLS